MSNLLRRLWADDRGFIISIEMLIIAVILVIGIIAGIAALRAGVATELTSLGSTVMNLDPCFDNVSVGSTTASSDGTPATHVDTGLSIGAANAVSTNTTTGTDALGQTAPFPLPITP
jgi:Flp pilus assembly pilin Flp